MFISWLVSSLHEFFKDQLCFRAGWLPQRKLRWMKRWWRWWKWPSSLTKLSFPPRCIHRFVSTFWLVIKFGSALAFSVVLMSSWVTHIWLSGQPAGCRVWLVQCLRLCYPCWWESDGQDWHPGMELNPKTLEWCCASSKSSVWKPLFFLFTVTWILLTGQGSSWNIRPCCSQVVFKSFLLLNINCELFLGLVWLGSIT